MLSLTLLVGCEPSPPDVKEFINGWEYVTTFKTYPLKSLSVEEGRVKMIAGVDNILVVSTETIPLLKPTAKNVRDLSSQRYLFIEISPSDTLIRADNLANSKLIREIVAMSPTYGAHNVKASEKIEIRRLTGSRWRIVSDLEDFKFNGEFSFLDSTSVASSHKEQLNDL